MAEEILGHRGGLESWAGQPLATPTYSIGKDTPFSFVARQGEHFATTKNKSKIIEGVVVQVINNFGRGLLSDGTAAEAGYTAIKLYPTSDDRASQLPIVNGPTDAGLCFYPTYISVATDGPSSIRVGDKAVVQDYFSLDAYKKTGYGHKKCKVITTVAMLYDLDDAHPFIEDVKATLEDDGVWVVQISYTPLMVKQMAFDNICHEHVYYHSLSSLKKLIEPHGFKIVDCSLNDTNGGSCRVYFQKENAKENSFGTKPLRDVCQFRVNSLLNYEANEVDISKPKVWKEFYQNLQELKQQTVDFIRQERAKGKVIYGYGASTKGNTLLQYYGLTSDDITAIAERSPEKYGKYVVGTNIPIVSEKQMRKANPDYLFVLPWHFIKEFCERETKFLNNGGKFIVPCPKFEVIGASKNNG